MKNLAIMKSVSGMTSRIGFQMKRHSPEILLVSGILSGIGCTIMACKATLRAVPVVESAKEKVTEIRELKAKPQSEELAKEGNKLLAQAYMKMALDVGLLYAPALFMGSVSVTCLLSSNNILRKRNASLAAAYATIAGTFKDYQARVREKIGEEAERDICYDIRDDEVEETIVNEKGKEKKVKKTVKASHMDNMSSYARFFDNGCEGWDENPEYSLMFLRAQEKFCNDKLEAQGYLFLNDVYELFGIPKTEAGQVVGWIYNKDGNPNGDNYVDLGLYNTKSRNARDFVNGYENVFIIDPNVDGPILDKAFDIEIRNM